ncbi:ATP-binding protein [Dongia deserti]|uniref:ATP-binding protein n=1 Tax=Dongia deserti TaxID=2268030 RepID=UPI000E64FF37|nr:ATP-binding protein [Dongia deserti]
MLTNASISRALALAGDLQTRMRDAAPFLVPLGAVAVATGISWALKGFIPDESLSMVFLLAVLVACVIHGRNVAILSALLAFLAYNFLTVEPRFRFSFAPLSDTLTIAVFLAVALLTGGLAGRVRDQARAMADRAATIGMLFDASRELAKSSDQGEITTILANQVSAATGAPADVFIRMDETIAWAARGPARAHADQATIAFADAAWSSLRHAGRIDLQNSRQSGLIAHPLGALRRPIGLLVWRNNPSSDGGRSMDEQTIAVFCELGAVALERVFLMEEITKTKILAETDRLRTALLSSISHDFRTPLAGILASATGLLEHGDHIERSMARELLVDIRDQAERINRYVANLLDMIKLESGAIVVRLEETDPIDIIAAATRRYGARGAEGWVKRAFPSETCLVEADPVLLEQAIFNVLDNAMQYSPADSRIEISVHADATHAEIVITDEGIGIPEADLERVFDKFYRVSADRCRVQGTGLGLSICRGLIEAMGGQIHARSPITDGHGTAIHLRLKRP